MNVFNRNLATQKRDPFSSPLGKGGQGGSDATARSSVELHPPPTSRLTSLPPGHLGPEDPPCPPLPRGENSRLAPSYYFRALLRTSAPDEAKVLSPLPGLRGTESISHVKAMPLAPIPNLYFACPGLFKKRITSAKSWLDRSFSRPSGINDFPLLFKSSSSLRKSVCSLPSWPRKVTLAADSLLRIPVTMRPLLVTATYSW